MSCAQCRNLAISPGKIHGVHTVSPTSLEIQNAAHHHLQRFIASAEGLDPNRIILRAHALMTNKSRPLTASFARASDRGATLAPHRMLKWGKALSFTERETLRGTLEIASGANRGNN